MQKIATLVFTCSSLVFGVIGISIILTLDTEAGPNSALMKLLFATVFIILPSFALSVAGKYLAGKP